MDITAILTQLKEQRDQIDKAIAALQGGTTKKPRGQKPGFKMSPEARRRISLAMKKRWAARKKAAA
jgi:hypothetical protein